LGGCSTSWVQKRRKIATRSSLTSLERTACACLQTISTADQTTMILVCSQHVKHSVHVAKYVRYMFKLSGFEMNRCAAFWTNCSFVIDHSLHLQRGCCTSLVYCRWMHWLVSSPCPWIGNVWHPELTQLNHTGLTDIRRKWIKTVGSAMWNTCEPKTVWRSMKMCDSFDIGLVFVHCSIDCLLSMHIVWPWHQSNTQANNQKFSLDFANAYCCIQKCELSCRLFGVWDLALYG